MISNVVETLTNASSRDVVRIERPSVLADAVSLVAVRLAVRVISASYLVARCYKREKNRVVSFFFFFLFFKFITFTRYMGRGSNEARLAFAVITAPRVAADRRRPARVRKTLVHVHALGSDRFEPVLAEASPLDALGVVHAIEVRLAEGGHVGLKIELVVVELQTRGENKIIKLMKSGKSFTCSQATLGSGLAVYPGGQTQL